MSRPATGQVVERRGKHGRTFALRFRACGQRRYLTLGTRSDGWTRGKAETELQNVLADVRRGIWHEPVDLPAVVEQSRPEPTFHEFASAYVERRRHEVEVRTVEGWRWALEGHLLPLLARYRLSQFTPELVDGYKAAKLRQREELLAQMQEWETDPAHCGRRPPRPLSNRSINETIKTLAMVLDDAIDYGHLETNPARGKKRRLK